MTVTPAFRSAAHADQTASEAAAPISRAGLLRLVVSHVADEIGRQRGRAVPGPEWRAWSGQTSVDEDGLGVDSLARLQLVGRIARCFTLHDTGVEDYLLVRRSLGEWAEVVRAGLTLAEAEAGAALMFESSGSTGAPRAVRHNLADLAAETALHAARHRDAARVVALVPPHHLYGFIFTVLLPEMAGLPVADLRDRTPSGTLAALRPGDLVIATPFQWELLVETGLPFPDGIMGASSGAPMPEPLWRRLAEAGLDRLTEVYGATETGGLGLRDGPASPFRLLPGLAFDADGLVLDPARHRRLEPQDRLVRVGADLFHVAGRLDNAVQIGGVNVHPERVRDVLTGAPGVADCAVRLDGQGAAARLKAFVVAAEPGILDAPEAFLAQLRTHLSDRLSPPERPVRIDLGTALPRTPAGKLADWG